jgi:hypothetical protein
VVEFLTQVKKTRKMLRRQVGNTIKGQALNLLDAAIPTLTVQNLPGEKHIIMAGSQ